MSCNIKEFAVFCMGLITGTGTTLTGKILYGIDSTGLDGTTKKFEKPIFQTWGMFLAMIFALPIHWFYHWYISRTTKSKFSFSSDNLSAKVPIKTYFLLSIPAAFDLIATFLANIGLLYVTVSSFQLMKCTVIIFVALVKVYYFKDQFQCYMWFGIGLNTIAVLLVGLTSLGDAGEQVNNTYDNPLLGIGMIVLSCLVQSCQYVFEEKLMDGGDCAPPLIVVGMEGFWGLLFTSLIVYPIAYWVPGSDVGSHERFDDAWVMLQNSTQLQIIFSIYLIVILGYNVFAVFVTYLLNSVWHAILDNFRPISVWGMDLLLFYVFTNGNFGERWTAWSYLQFCGMILLLVGTAIYNGTIKLPGQKYDEATQNQILRTPENLTSSSLSRSPLIVRHVITATNILRNTPNLKEKEKEAIRSRMIADGQPQLTRRSSGEYQTIGSLPKYGSFEG